MRFPVLTDKVVRAEDATSATDDVVYAVTNMFNNAVQIEADASATGVVTIGGSLDYQHETVQEYPVVCVVDVSANSRHLRWFSDMPMHTMKLDFSGLLSGSVTVKTSGTGI